MIGKTNPIEARSGTVRGDFALNVQKNMIHASDSLENAKREIGILFGLGEILEYRKPTDAKYMF
jgi:nucleoside-diphosphate kinase